MSEHTAKAYSAKQDGFTLRRLSAQMKVYKVSVKLYLREPLHAKLYLAHRPDDNFNKFQTIMGISNPTYSGFTKQGEMNAEFGDSDSAEKKFVGSTTDGMLSSVLTS